MFSMNVQVDPKLAERLKKLSAELPRELRKALYNEMTRLIAAAAERAPRETGQLAQSAFVRPSDESGVVVGGFAAPYATVLHERHDLHHRHGEPKYLQHAADANVSGMLGRLAKELGPTLGGRQVSSAQRFPAQGNANRRPRSRRTRARTALKR